MAKNSQHTEVTLTMSARQAASTLTSLQNQADDLRKRLQAAVDAGNKADAKKLQREINQVNAVMRRMQTESANAAEVLQRLDKATPNELRKALSTLQRQIRNVSKDSPQFAELANKIQRVKTAIQETNEAMRPQPGLWDRIKNSGAATVLVYQQVISALGNLKAKAAEYVEQYAGMQEEMAGVSKYSGLAAEDVETLNDRFKEMDTRTSREELNRMAQDAGRLGKQSVDDIMGFVAAADQINVALDDLGDGATLTLSKITGLFGIEAEYGTEQALLKTGSVINDLSQNCSASAGYIAEFTSRMAAAGKQANLTIPQIMSYAAVMDESSVNVEQSSTAISKLIIHLMQEPAKYAKAAGLDLKTWYATMQKDANEGFLQFVDALKKKGGLDQLAPLFKEMGENGIGAMNALGLLAGQIDKVRAQQDAANESFELGTSITNEFNVANNTVAAQLDKNKNALHEIQVGIGQQLLPVYNILVQSSIGAARAVSYLIKVLMENKTEIIAAVTAIGLYTIAVNAAAIKTVFFTAMEKARQAVMTAGRAITLAASAAYNTLTGNVSRAAAAMRSLNTIANASKLGIVGLGAVIATATVALVKFATSFSKAAIAAEGTRKAQEALAKIQKEAVVQAQEQKQKVEALVAAAQNETLALQDRQKAIAQLNKIVPGYNAQLDATTGKYKANKKALDKYIDSLIHLYEVQGAKDTLITLGKQKAELKLQRQTAQDNLNSIEKNRPAASQTPATTGGGSMPGVTFSLAYDAGLASGYKTDIANIDRKLSTIEAQENQIRKVYGKDIQQQAINETPPETSEPTITPTGAPTTSSASTSAEDKKAAEAARKRAEKKQKEEFQKGLREIEAEWKNADAESIGLYKTGALTLSEYRERLHDSETKMFDDKIQYYKDAGLEEDEDVADFRKKKEEADLKYKETKQKTSLAALKREQQMQEDQAQMDYVTPGTKIYKNEKALQERLFRLKVDYLYRTRALYEAGSDEYERMNEEIAKTEQDEQIRKQKQTAELLLKYSKDYRLQDAKDREKMEIATLDALHARGLMSEEDYQKALKEIRERFQKEREEQEGKVKKKMSSKDSSINSEWGSLVAGLYDALSGELDASEDKLVAWSKKVAAIAQAAFAMLSAISTQISSYTQAQVEYETAKIEKSYDARIKAAGKNSKKTKQLEEEKEREIAKIKAKASRENFAIQVATAIAQTAANAISAYGSVIGIPVVGPTLAPIAAALAVAAGMVQIATIRKQQQTTALQGYSEGGFTGSGHKEEEAGVVHRGEWVAPAWMVNDHRARPMIDILERARRTNVFPSITPNDVAATMIAPVIGARASGRSAELLADRADTPAESPEKISREKELAATLARLTSLLDNGISANVSVAGSNGINQANRRYNQLMKNRQIR